MWALGHISSFGSCRGFSSMKCRVNPAINFTKFKNLTTLFCGLNFTWISTNGWICGICQAVAQQTWQPGFHKLNLALFEHMITTTRQCGSDPEVPLLAMVLLVSIRRSETWLALSGQVCESDAYLQNKICQYVVLAPGIFWVNNKVLLPRLLRAPSSSWLSPIPRVWNAHIWKHYDDWKETYPWLEVQQTGLGCSICAAAGVTQSSWSKFRACRKASYQDWMFNFYFCWPS